MREVLRLGGGGCGGGGGSCSNARPCLCLRPSPHRRARIASLRQTQFDTVMFRNSTMCLAAWHNLRGHLLVQKSLQSAGTASCDFNADIYDVRVMMVSQRSSHPPARLLDAAFSERTSHSSMPW